MIILAPVACTGVPATLFPSSLLNLSGWHHRIEETRQARQSPAHPFHHRPGGGSDRRSVTDAIIPILNLTSLVHGLFE